MPTDRRPEPRVHDENVADEGTGPLDRGRPNWVPDEDDLETVRATPWSEEDGTMDDAPLDPATTRVHHLPLSFIGESVIDPETRDDSNAAAALWRNETVRRHGVGASTVRLRQAPADAATQRLRRSPVPKRRPTPVDPTEEFPLWDYLVFAIGMLAVFVAAFGAATWYWVL